MKTVLQSLKEMEVSLLRNQPALEALEQIEILRSSLRSKPGVDALLGKLQDECAPGAERAKTELATIRDAIKILEDQPPGPESKLELEIPEDSLPNHESDHFSTPSAYPPVSDQPWRVNRFSPNDDFETEVGAQTASNGEIQPATAAQLA